MLIEALLEAEVIVEVLNGSYREEMVNKEIDGRSQIFAPLLPNIPEQ